MSFVNDIDHEKFPDYAQWVLQNPARMTDGKSNTISSYASISYSYYNYFTVNTNAAWMAPTHSETKVTTNFAYLVGFCQLEHFGVTRLERDKVVGLSPSESIVWLPRKHAQ